jgi:hypothetical protein
MCDEIAAEVLCTSLSSGDPPELSVSSYYEPVRATAAWNVCHDGVCMCSKCGVADTLIDSLEEVSHSGQILTEHLTP